MLDVTGTTVITATNWNSIEPRFRLWLAENGKRGQGHSDKSIESYLSDMRAFVTWYETHTGDPFQPAEIISSDFRDYFHHSIKIEQVSASTWNRRRATLAQFCLFALAVGLIQMDPFQGVPYMSKASQAPKSLTIKDFRRYMRRVEQEINLAKTDFQRSTAIRNRAMIALMVRGGLRVGEVCELAPCDLLLTDRKGQVFIRDGKGNKAGTAYLGSEARLTVNEWLKIRPQTALVFQGLTERQIERIVSDIAVKAGFQPIQMMQAGKMIEKQAVTPHSLRHTFIYNVLQETGNIERARELARHSRIDQTADYARSHEEDLTESVEHLYQD